MFGLSFWEIAVVLVVALLALGPERLPGLLRTIGRGMRELRRASNDLRHAFEEPLDELKRPLQDIRDEVANTVRQAERQIEAEGERIEASLAAPALHSPNRQIERTDHDTDEQAPTASEPPPDTPGPELLQASAPVSDPQSSPAKPIEPVEPAGPGTPPGDKT